MSFSKSAWLKSAEDESEDDEILEEVIRDRPDAICYLIECSDSMLATDPFLDADENERQRSNVSTAIRSALELMKTRIVSGSPRDVVGVVLYDTVATKYLDGELPKKGVYVLLEPGPIRAANIKMLKDLLEEAETSPQSFSKRFRPVDSTVESTQLVSGMKVCDSLLKNRSSNISNRYLYLFTDNDDPFQGSKQLEKPANTFAKDAHDAGFQIRTFFTPVDAAEFDLSKFWNRFRFDPSEDVEMDNAAMIFSGEKRFDNLLSLSSEAGKTKRAMFTIPLYLYDGIALGVTGYAAVGEQRKKAPVNIEQAEDIREVYHKVAYTEASTGDTITDPKKDIIKYASIGAKGKHEERLFFEADEVLKIKNLGMSPSLKLLGFLPRKDMKEQYTCKHSYLIYPNETTYANSIPAFSALLKSMLKKEVVGLGVLIARSNSSPQLVYMLPQGEKRNEDDLQEEPPCIWLIQIPFADDIREPTVKTCLSIANPESKESAELMKQYSKVIRHMQIDYKPYQFENPVLQYHYNILAAIALQEDTPRAEDSTFPDAETIVGRVSKYTEKINSLVSEHPALENYQWKMAGLSGSSGAGGRGEEIDENAAKKVKVSNKSAVQDVKVLEKTLKKAFEGGTIGKVTNDTYKSYLTQKGHKSVSGLKKADLIAKAKEQLIKDKVVNASLDEDEEEG